MLPVEAAGLLEFWFGALSDPAALDAGHAEHWFRDGRAWDIPLRERFGSLHERARRGELDAWTSTPHGRLALILLLDQCPRHIHRGHAEAFASDRLAQQHALIGIVRGDDAGLHPAERLFHYLPLEHAEDIVLQAASVAAFMRLHAETPPALRVHSAGWLDFAERHRAVIARFGRFPDLNPLLGRPSTPEEQAFLAEPGSSFL